MHFTTQPHAHTRPGHGCQGYSHHQYTADAHCRDGMPGGGKPPCGVVSDGSDYAGFPLDGGLLGWVGTNPPGQQQVTSLNLGTSNTWAARSPSRRMQIDQHASWSSVAHRDSCTLAGRHGSLTPLRSIQESPHLISHQGLGSSPPLYCLGRVNHRKGA